MKKVTGALLALFLTGATAAHADHLQYGGWSYDDNRGGSEEVILGDGDDRGLYLGGSPRYCVRPGASYARMREIMSRNNHQWISWWIADSCRDGYIRVCIENEHVEQACSTYKNLGWHYFRQ